MVAVMVLTVAGTSFAGTYGDIAHPGKGSISLKYVEAAPRPIPPKRVETPKPPVPPKHAETPRPPKPPRAHSPKETLTAHVIQKAVGRIRNL